MLARLRTDDRLRSAIRFAVGLSVADAAALWLFGTSTIAVMVAFAVIVQLYFLDFDGTWRERLLGLVAATAVGTAAVTLGVLVAPTRVLAVGVAFLVVAVFSLARVLQGHVARSSVGLTAAFFWPVMLPAHRDRLGSYVLAWLLGCAIATVVGLIVLPRRRSDRVCAALEAWLRAAAALTRALVRDEGLDATSRDLDDATKHLTQVTSSASGSLGGVGRRQRAIGEMVSRAIWSWPIVAQLRTDSCDEDGDLAMATAAAFEESARLVGSGPAPATLTDLESARRAQLERLDGEAPAAITESYPLRVTSLLASIELWLAAGLRRIDVRAPDVGDVTADAPGAIVRTALRPDSVWLRSAVMSGIGAGACLWMVRSLGLEHGLWVVLAALISFQGAFSATAGGRRLVASSLGAAGGVVIAGSLFLADPPHAVFVVLLPISAFAAKYAQPSKMWVSQLVFSPFVLANLVVLGSTDRAHLVVERVENIALGAVVAAILTLLVFPVGIRGLLERLSARADETARSYARERIAAAEGEDVVSATPRAAVTSAIAILEATLVAGHLAARVDEPALQSLDRRHAFARECLLAGDTCGFLADRPGGATSASTIARWWSSTLDELESPISRP